jgi:hypothetical protein
VVFKLIKFGIGLLGLGVFCWFGLMVPLGDHTLFGHLSAIGKSKESQELMRGTKEKVGDLKKKIVGGELTRPAKEKPAEAAPGEHAPASPQERLTHVDRKEIRHFIDSARTKIATAPKSN